MTAQIRAARLPLLVFTAVFFAGCSMVPESTPSLDAARSAHNRAKNNPDVLRHAGQNLDRAGQTLASAAAADSEEEMDSLAYVAKAEVETAEAIAQRRNAEDKVRELSKVKEQVQLEVREAELAATRSRLQESQQQLAALEAKKTERGTVVTLGNVLFEVGKANLMAGAMSSIDRLAEYLRGNPDKTVLIEGHTDSTGSNELNMRLSRDRAEAVQNALLTRDIGGDRIRVAGLGPAQPIASNSTAAGRQQNRRVEVIIR